MKEYSPEKILCSTSKSFRKENYMYIFGSSSENGQKYIQLNLVITSSKGPNKLCHYS